MLFRLSVLILIILATQGQNLVMFQLPCQSVCSGVLCFWKHGTSVDAGKSTRPSASYWSLVASYPNVFLSGCRYLPKSAGKKSRLFELLSRKCKLRCLSSSTNHHLLFCYELKRNPHVRRKRQSEKLPEVDSTSAIIPPYGRLNQINHLIGVR